MICSKGHFCTILDSTDFRELKRLPGYKSNCSISHVSMSSAHLACLSDAQLAPLGIKKTGEAEELNNTLFQMESFKVL